VAVRWGFLGAGAVATNFLAPAVHAADGAELYSVAARDSRRAAALAPSGPAYSTYEGLVADANVDAVYVALPNDRHRPLTMAALEAGKHVLCEKPLGLNVGDVDVMADAASRSGRLLAEALFYRWHPQTQRTEQLVRDGRIGEVRHVDAGFTFNGVAPDSFRLDPRHGGGALYDLGCYPISAALSAFGESPLAVEATVSRGPTGVDLSADLVLQFADGDAHLHVAIDEPARQWLSITGDELSLVVAERPFTAWFGPDSELRIGAEVTTVPATDPYRLMVEQVTATIAGDPAYVVPLEETRKTAAVIAAAFESAADGGRAVKL
jgi:xylose dehydrogenase (NAD/NADP)